MHRLSPYESGQRRHRMRFWRALLCVLLSLSGCRVLGVARDPEAVLRVALIAPLSGDFQALGQSARNGAVLAIEAWNARGGVLGLPVQLVALDGGCDYDMARRVVQEAIQQQAIRFFIGGVCGVESEAIARLTLDAEVLQISPASVQPALTLDGDGNVRPFVFRVPFVDPDQALAAAQFALTRLNARRAGIVYDKDSAYARTLVETFRSAFEAGGGRVVAAESYDRGSEVFFDALEVVRAEAPDVLYMPGYHTVAAKLVSQARAFGMAQPVIGSDGWDAPGLPLGAVDNSYFTVHFWANEPRPAVLAWVNQYSQSFLTPPDAVATLTYDATNLLLTAMTTAASREPFAVAATLETLTFEAVSGSLAFDENHNPYKDVVILHVRGGQLSFQERLQPRQREP